MKKLLAIAPYSYLPYYSGGQKFMALFFKYLGKETDLTVVSVPENNFSLAMNYKKISVLKKSFFRYLDPSLPSKIIALIKKEKHEAIIWEHPYHAWAAFFVKNKTGIKTIIHSHNIEYQRFRSLGKWWWKILRTYEKWFFRFADLIFFISEEDKKFAIEEWHIDPSKCIEVPFGIEIAQYPGDKKPCNEVIKARHHIEEKDAVLLFNGALDYKPNLDALKTIIENINPLLLVRDSFNYTIIICGKNLPAHFNSLAEYANKNIVYAGFVDDIETYFKGADLFLNPVQTGGGVKTKMVEAIGFGTTVIATEDGAIGVKQEVCGNKLVLVSSNDPHGFSEAVFKNARVGTDTPAVYYDYYYYGGIIKRLIETVFK